MSTTVQWRYVVLGLGFLALAGVRAAQGAWVWMAIFVLAGVANAWLALQGDRGEGSSAASGAPTEAEPHEAEPHEVERERARCLTAQRQWQVLGFTGALLAAGLLLLEPPLAVLGGLVALFALFRARRVRRYAATLPRRPGTGDASVPRPSAEPAA
ncbi:hypothetical protein [Actinomycetospora cinnamomea]|uniref:Uncharacterized protein n=1 Tax=Actinomycetospora cinnamomea TaxID=663609 RepID=A0A2U1F7J3_9PSEU|nr:hypothetical protein [Actinomycetospora cinnamomea]PVZ08132.1 hypothetical protein C8D89_10915 [Actinomycetospora cinnamomea]